MLRILSSPPSTCRPLLCHQLVLPLTYRLCGVQHVVRAAENEDDELKKDWKFGRNEGPMTWPWKLMCAILYMLPWVDVTEKTVYFIERFPAFHWTEYFTGPGLIAGCLLDAQDVLTATTALHIGAAEAHPGGHPASKDPA